MKDEILQLRSEGFTYNQIQEKLGCSKSTISYYCGKNQQFKTLQRSRKNRAKINAKRILYINYLKKFVSRYKSLSGCQNCGIKDPRVLEFDHINPSTKRYEIGNLTSSGSPSMKTLKLEIRKCRVLCANCHRIRTAIQYDYRTMYH